MNDSPDRILVVDDERGIREGCRRILAATGYEVETAADGEEGLELFRRGGFSAGLVDLKLPRMDGLDLIGRLRELDEDAVLLVITAYATIETAVEATKRGAYGFVSKPFTPEELLLPIKQGLERRTLARQAKRLHQESQKCLLEVAFERSKCNTVIKCMADGVLVFNREGQVVLRNAAAARAFPECAACALPTPLNCAVKCEELKQLATEVLEAGVAPVIASKEVSCGDGTYMANASPVVEPDGDILGGVVVFRDVSAFNKLQDAKSMFVALVAHELASPLAEIEQCLDRVPGADLDDRQELAQAKLVTQNLRLLVSELHDLSAIETGKFTVKRSPLDICDVAREAAQACRPAAECREIDLAVACDNAAHEAEMALADHDAMLTAFTNLIDNAVKYTPQHGHVRVRVESDNMYVKVVVWDDGIGMTPEEKDHAFDEFFRASNDHTARTAGTGLGLTLAQRLVQLHEGRIAVRTAPSQGSEFTVYLPTP